MSSIDHTANSTNRKLVHWTGAMILLYAFSLAAFSNEGFPASIKTSATMPYLADKPVGEDAFYMLLVAWNIAAGHGAVANEGIAVTGIQPLSTVVFSALAKIVQVSGGDKWDFVRVILFFGVLNLIAFAHLVGRIAAHLSADRDDEAYSVAACLCLLNFWFFRAFAYGLETGLYLTSFAAVLLFSLRRIPCQRSSDFVLLGILAGVTGLCRIDFGIVLAVFLLSMLARGILDLRHTVLVGIVALTVVSPWFIWVYVVSGHVMPSSGPAQATSISWATAVPRLSAMIQAVLEHLTPWLYSRNKAPVVALDAITLAAFAVLAHRYHERRAYASNSIRVFWGWAAGVLLLLPVYVALFWAKHFYPRYISPLSIITLPVMAIILLNMGSSFKLRGPRLQRLLYLGFALSFAAFAFLSLHTGKIGNPHAVTAGFVRDTLPPGINVGAFQSGVIGYFNANVTNLDGKLNRTMLPHLRDETVPEYLDEHRISVLVDWPSYITRHMSVDDLERSWKRCSEQPGNDSTACYIRKEPLPLPL